MSAAKEVSGGGFVGGQRGEVGVKGGSGQGSARRASEVRAAAERADGGVSEPGDVRGRERVT